MSVAVRILSLCCAAVAVALASAEARAQSTDADLKLFAVHVNRTPRQSWPGYGIYLGNGLILTASHVPGAFASTKPHVVIAGQDLPTGLVKEGSLDGVDLTLLSIDATSLPVRLRMRRMPICERAPYPGEAVVVAIPEGTARSRVLPRQAIPADLRGRIRHRDRRCRHHRQFWLGSIRRRQPLPAWDCQPQDLRHAARGENWRPGHHDQRYRQILRPGARHQVLHPARRHILGSVAGRW